jgi:hypothetical protein
MFDLFKNEFKRFLMPALVMMIVHLAVWGLVYTQKPILQNHIAQSSILNIMMILGGLLFGVLQMYLHRRKNNWTYLLHRPLSVETIHIALVAAAALLMFIAVILPFALVLVSLDLFSSQPVELRHYLFLLHMIALTLSCYLIGTYTALSSNKGALLTLGLVFLMIDSKHSTAFLTLATDLIITGIVFGLSRLSFKENLGRPFKNKRHTFIAALVIQPALAFIVVFTQTLYYHLPLMLLDLHPDQATKEQNEGYLSILWMMENDERVKMLLENSKKTTEYKEQLVAQVKLATSEGIDGRPSLTPVRGELFYKDKSYGLTDEANNKQWIFSHSKMLFEGRNIQSGEQVGYLTKVGFLEANTELNNNVRFSTIPTLTDNKYVQTENTIYSVDFDEQLMEVKHQLIDGEIYQSEIMFSSDTALFIILSDKAMYLFEPSEFSEDNVYTEPSHRVNHPMPLGYDTAIRYSVLIDGYLIEYRSSQFYGFEKPGATLVYAKHDGLNEVISEMSFIDYRPIPRLVTNSDYWASPIINGYLFSFIQGLYNPYDERYLTLDNFDKRIYDKDVYLLCILLALFSAWSTYFIASKMPMDKSTRNFWIVTNLIFGIPGLLAFLLMNPWRDYLFYRYDNSASA